VLGRGAQSDGFQVQDCSCIQANVINCCDITEMAKRLGNPLYHEVKQPDEEASRRIHEWFSNGRFAAVPVGARHLVLLDSYYCGMERSVF
jgi:hypothetical protein